MPRLPVEGLGLLPNQHLCRRGYNRSGTTDLGKSCWKWTLVTPHLTSPHLFPSTCLKINDFLYDCSQRAKVGPHIFSTHNLCPSYPHSCVLRTLLFTLYNHNYTPSRSSNLKCARNTTVVGLIFWGTSLHTEKRGSGTKVDIQPLFNRRDCVDGTLDIRFLSF